MVRGMGAGIMTGDLITWLRAQLDEDRRVALNAGHDAPTWTYDRDAFSVASSAWPIASKRGDGSMPLCDVDGEHIARWDPARVLAEVEAKRLLLDLHKGCTAHCYILRVLALPYADREGYQESWRP